jgi:hypothetical protein
LSQGMEFLASYTLSRNLADSFTGCGSVNAQSLSPQDSYNRRGDFGPACSDQLHAFAAGGFFEIPFGRGRRYGSSARRAFDLLLGGWSVSLFAMAHSGFPVTIFATGFQGQTGQPGAQASVRPNRYRLLSGSDRNPDHWFGTGNTFCLTYGVNDGACSYGLPTRGTFGNAGIGTERAPAYFNLDGSLGKQFHVAEKKYVEFRGEFFNALNHVSLAAPGRDISTPATFGLITAQIGNPRNIQFGVKVGF